MRVSKLKMSACMIGVMFSFIIMAGTADAELSWAICKAKKIGANADNGTVLLQVKQCNSDPTGGDANGFMTLSDVQTDQMMATVLTGMSLNYPLAIGFDGAKNPASGKNIAKAVNLAVPNL